MMLEVGFCPGIENYSRPLSGPPARLDAPTRCSIFFPDDFLLFVDESHATVPQVRACSPATKAASRRWSSTAFACPARSTTGR